MTADAKTRRVLCAGGAGTDAALRCWQVEFQFVLLTDTLYSPLPADLLPPGECELNTRRPFPQTVVAVEVTDNKNCATHYWSIAKLRYHSLLTHSSITVPSSLFSNCGFYGLLKQPLPILYYWENYEEFLPRDALLSAVYAVVVCLCVCVCVCVSVTLRYCIKTAKRRITQITPHDSPVTLVFWCQRTWWNSNGITPDVGDKCRWGALKFVTFDENRALTRKRYKIDTVSIKVE